jgi:hypothetical protein
MSNHPDDYHYPQHNPSSYPHLHQHNQSEEFKPQYDDLIDAYGSPYRKTSQHQTHAVEAPSLSPVDHRRRSSFPLTNKSYSSEFTAKGSDEPQIETPRSYPPSLPLTKEVTPRSFWQNLLPESLACRLYVLTVLVETAIDLAIEGDLLIRFHEAEQKSTQPDHDLIVNRKMPVYLSIFALAHVFQFIMAIDAVYARNTLQFISLAIFNALFLVYAIIQIGEIRNTLTSSEEGISHIPVEVLTAIIPCVISVAEVAYIALGWKIYHEFGWKVYKFLGADRSIKKMYASYQIFQCFIKFDVFFWVGFSVQFIALVLRKNDWEFYVTCAALPLSVILLIEGHLAARHENKWMMVTFMSGCVGAMVYFSYKLYKVIRFQDSDFRKISKSLSTFSVIAIALLIATFVFAIVVMRNFGRGLKDAVDKNRKNPPAHQRYTTQNPHQRAPSKHLNRMSID